MRKINLHIAVAVCIFLMTLAWTFGAVTHYVNPGESIQAAINNANDGDQIEVAPGIYYEAINFNGKKVRLYSSGGANVTTINGTGHYHVVQCVSGEDANTILKGFTITGGNANGASSPDNCGGGMYNSGSSPTVIACAFYKNSTGNGQDGAYPGGAGGHGGGGGGMYNYNSNPIVSDCEFSENSTGDGGVGGDGENAGVFSDGGDGGKGGSGGSGAGMYNFDSSPTMDNCNFIANRTGSGNTGGKGGNPGAFGEGGKGGTGGGGGRGAGMFNYKSFPTLTDCNFRENVTGDGGDGAYSFWGDGGNGGNGGDCAGMNNSISSPTVIGCTFKANKTGSGGNGNSGSLVTMGIGGNGGNGGNGAGLLNTAGSSPVVTDCTFTKNTTGNGGNGGRNGDRISFIMGANGRGGLGGCGAGMVNTGGSSPTISDCNFTENECGVGGNGGHGMDRYVLVAVGGSGPGGPGGDGGKGGGVYNSDGGSPTFRNCIFKSNKGGDGGCGGRGGSLYSVGAWNFAGDGGKGGSGGNGGGMGNYSSSPSVIGCEFSENKSGSGQKGGNGGGVYGSLLLAIPGFGGDGGNGGSGAGIFFHECSLPDVNSCAFFGNETGRGGLAGRGGYAGLWTWVLLVEPSTDGDGGSGGGIGNSQSSPVVSNCTFRYNTALYGGGIYNSEYNPTVTNCTFRQNLGKIDGGGIYTSSGSPTVTNCILWEDTPNEIAGTAPNVSYCDIEGGYAGTGNINAYPVFADNAGRFSAGSPCIDTGSNSAPYLPAKDFDGWPRITGNTVDMGAFECTDYKIQNMTAGTTAMQAPINKNSWPLNETPDNLYLTIQAAIDDANDDDEICVLPGTYYSAINFLGKSVRLYSTSGPQFTTIDGTGNFHVVQCVSGEDANTILDGFTITGGNANGTAPDNCGGGMYCVNSSPTVNNCTITNNSAYDGAGMHDYNSSPTMTNCNFSYNVASHNGGGMYNTNSSNPTVTNCTFTTNSTDTHGGGLVNILSSSPTITNCTFSGNTASGLGGGMINSVNCSPTIINCVYRGNSADYGAGIYNNDNSNPIVTNCTLTNNTAITAGNAMHNAYSSPTVTNCILWGEISNDSSSLPVVTYCDVKMPSGTYPGTGNINADPGFSWAMITGRPECSRYLSSSASPCVDAGDSNAPNLPDTDRGGQPRIIDGDVDGNSTVDMGAYEFQPCVKNVTRNRWYQLIQHSVEDACDYDRIEVNPGTYYESIDLMLAPNNFVLTSIDPNDPNIVEQTIIDAKFGGHVIHFWSQEPSCIVAGFTLTVSVNPLMGLEGGFGYGIFSNWANPTITNCVITKTLGVRFDSGSPVISGCTIRDNPGGLLVFGAWEGGNAVVEDCIITGNYGGADYGPAVVTANTTIARCIVSGNRCTTGGIECMGDANIENCVISDNWGWNGGIHSTYPGSHGKISGCTISNNEGSGINCWAGPIENCIITGNAGPEHGEIMDGGGISQCTGPITNCIISGNKAEFGGGIGRCTGSITNCVITGNYGIYGGGVSYCDSGTISNCTILGNVAWSDISPGSGEGGGLWNYHGTITNCIIRQNWAQTSGDQLYLCSEPNYSCIEEWSGGGVGNISDDPCFVYAGYWADANDPNTVVEPNDPNAVWVNGYYRLRRGSPCIDAGDNNSVPADISDLDSDGDVNEPIPFDFGGLPRFIEDHCTVDSGNPGTPGPPVVDMGVFEFLPADIDSSGAVNLYDLSMLALHLGETGCGRCGGANLNCDIKVDFNDLRLLTDWWLAGIGLEL